MSVPMLELRQVTYRIGPLEVVRDLNLSVAENEVVGLAGISGSGKSVIAKLVGGVYQPASGLILQRGQRLPEQFKPVDYGLEVMHQNPVLVEGLSLTHNLFLGQELYRPGLGRLLRWVDQERMEGEAARALMALNARIPSLDTTIRNLSNEQRQLVTLARVLISSAPMIVIDEPTFLGYPYQQKLLTLIEDWRQSGRTVLFASMDLDQLFAVCDRIFVLHKGQICGEFRAEASSREEVVAAMVGYTAGERPTPALWALDSYYRAREKADSLSRQMMVLERDLQMQGRLNQQLLAQLAEQVKALDLANNALQDAHRRLLTEREEERKYLARELHDDVIQNLLSTNYQLEAIEAGVLTAPELGEQLEDVRDLIRELVDDIRRICGDLRPPTIDSLGLPAALQSFSREWSKRTGIAVTLELKLASGRLPEAIELSVFRIVQEALSNIHRHAHASQVDITLAHPSPRSLSIEIADDGDGLRNDFSLSRLAGEGHYGLLGISERAALLNGRCHIHNRPEGGALLQVEIEHPRMG